MEVTTVRCLVSRGGSIVGFANADLVFISGVPHVAFDWEVEADGDARPIHLVELDPQLLLPLPPIGDVTHLYRIPVADPRPFS